MDSLAVIKLIDETAQRILDEGKVKSPEIAHEIAIRWVKGIAS